MIEQNNSIKILDIIFNLDVEWNQDMNNIISNTSSSIFEQRHIKGTFSIDILKLFNISEMESVLVYDILIWDSNSASETIFLCQKKALRIMAGAPYLFVATTISYIHIPMHGLTLIHKSESCMGIKIYNKLPTELKEKLNL